MGTVTLQMLLISVAMTGGALLFALQLSHRPHFALSAVCGGVLCSAVGFAASWLLAPYDTLLATECAALLIWALLLGLLLACCQVPLSVACYCAVWALTVQQFLLQMWNILYTYGLHTGALVPGNWYMVLFCLPAADVAVYFTLARWLPETNSIGVGPRQLSSALLLLLVFEILHGTVMQGPVTVTLTGSGVLLIMCEFYCLTVLYLQNALFSKSAMRQELMTMNVLWHQRKEQYDLAKENIALINQKCHDLKHQVRALRGMPDSHEREKYLDEIDDSIRIYEAIVKTGSEALDTILTEKSLLCKEKNIQVHCVADGSRMGFIDPVDLYSIFGNALDNAIEEVQKFHEKEKRQIDVMVYMQQQFLVINVSNPLADCLKFQDGLPVTTKGDNGYHGFGLKSVRHTLKKYDGFMTVGVEQGCFALKVLIPASEMTGDMP